MEGSHLRMWIITTVVLYGLSWNSYGQKTFRRSCDCEYMVDGKCAYTLLLPTGQGEGMCPQSGDMDSNDGEMNIGMQQRVSDLQRNFTDLLSMYSSQATMLNQVYSTLMDKLLTCPLLASCAMPDFTVPDVKIPTPSVPTAKVPDVTMPDIEIPDITISDIEKPEITMPDIEVPDPAIPTVNVPEVTMPDIKIPMPKCIDVCPDIDTQIESLRIMASELDRTVVRAVANITNIFNLIQTLNDTVIELGIQILLGDDDPRRGPIPRQGGPGENPGTGNLPAAPIPGAGGLGSLPNASMPKPNLDITLGSLGQWVNNIINNGLLCSKKGPLVSGEDSYLPDTSITASSVFNYQHVAARGRITAQEDGDLNGAWCPGEPNTPGQEWIQFDLGRVRTVYGIVTRGRADYEQWVTSYMVYHIDEMNPVDPAQTVWTQVTDMLGIDTVIFDGNKNQNSPKFQYFDNPIQARYIRIIPLSANQGQNMCMRADVIGCVEEPSLL